MSQYVSYSRLGGLQGRSGRMRKNLPPWGVDPQTVQPIVSHYIDYIIPAHMNRVPEHNRMFVAKIYILLSWLMTRCNVLQYKSLPPWESQNLKPTTAKNWNTVRLQMNAAVSKLVVTQTEHQLWRLHSTTGRCSPHFHRNVRVLLNRVLQQRWIGRAAKGDNHLLPWPPRSPDLTPWNFFLWGFVKDSVYVPPLFMSLNELRARITHALQTITADMIHPSLGRIWLPCGCVSCEPGCIHWRIVINT